jgi:nicotinate-nucleotide adenylyltransferase
MNIGVFGGTFDPPHLGHLLTAVDALERVALDRIIFVPNAVHPLKGRAQASPAERLKMVSMLVSQDPRFQVDDIEIRRDGPSYTVDTLERLSSAHAGSTLTFLLGPDAAATFPAWRNTRRILELASIVVVTRIDSLAGAAAGAPLPAIPGVPGGFATVATRRIDISSSEVRDRVGRNLSLRGFVSEAVELYIAEMGLYRRDQKC